MQTVYQVRGKLYWRDGARIAQHIKLKPDTKIVELPDLHTLREEAYRLLYNDNLEEQFDMVEDTRAMRKAKRMRRLELIDYSD